MTVCSLCGFEREKQDLVFIELYKSNGFVWQLNNYICRDKCKLLESQ